MSSERESIEQHDSKTSGLQKAVVVTNPGPDARVEIKDIEIPEPGADDVLIHLSHTGVCHADVAFIYGEWEKLGFGLKGSQTPGHEGIGRVVAVGSNVKNFTIGDRAGVKWLHSVCWTCSYCKRGREDCCTSHLVSGRHVPGSFQQFVTSPANYTPKIPDAISDEKAGPLMCAGVTMYRALKMSTAVPGDWVAIMGAGGGLGHLGIQYAKSMGFKVVGIDSGDKGTFCTSMGADAFIDFTKTQDVPDLVRKITEGGAFAVLVAVSSRKSYEQAAEMLSSGGTLICIGLPSESFNIPLQPMSFLKSGCWVTGVNASPIKDIQDALDFAALHQISPTIQVFPLAQAVDAFEKLREQKVAGRVVLDLRSS